jgi:hypothetical protein
MQSKPHSLKKVKENKMSSPVATPVSPQNKNTPVLRKTINFVLAVFQSGKRLVATIASFFVIVAGVVYTQQDRVPLFREIVVKFERILDDGVREVEKKTGVDIPDEELRMELRKRGY